MICTGKIAWFRANKGYGFIHPDDGSDDIYMHAVDLTEGPEEGLVEGAAVSYQVSGSPRGPKAVKVKLLNAEPEWHEDDKPAPQPEPEPEWSWQDEIHAVVDKHVQAMTAELKQVIAGWST